MPYQQVCWLTLRRNTKRCEDVLSSQHTNTPDVQLDGPRTGCGAGVIVGTDGLPVLLRGIIWSGFQNGTMLEGLQVMPAHSRQLVVAL